MQPDVGKEEKPKREKNKENANSLVTGYTERTCKHEKLGADMHIISRSFLWLKRDAHQLINLSFSSVGRERKHN